MQTRVLWLVVTLLPAPSAVPIRAQIAPPAGQATTQALTEDQKIEALIHAIQNLEGAVFIRNGEEHNASSATSHLRTKWNAARSKIKTARDFIEVAASKSSTSGTPYTIRGKDGRETTSAEFLNAALLKIEGGQPVTMDSVAMTQAGSAAKRQASQPTATQPTSDAAAAENPAAEGFNVKDSDPRAIELADQVMAALGGRKAWDQTRFLSWRFFGGRLLVWDKTAKRVRLEIGAPGTDNHTVTLVNTSSWNGRSWKGGREITNQVQLSQALNNTINIWRNDSAWMFIPYRMKDTGVMLKYLGERAMQDRRLAEVVQVTFDPLPFVPDYKYDLYIAKDTHLVEQWSFYDAVANDKPRFTMPWGNWKRYGRIKLSDDRGPGRKFTDVAVYEELPDEVFTSNAPVDLMSFPHAEE